MQISSDKRTHKLKYIDINIISSNLPRHLKDHDEHSRVSTSLAHLAQLTAQFDVVVKCMASVFCCPHLQQAESLSI